MDITTMHLDTSSQVKEFLLVRGASVAGIAEAPAFDDAPAGHRATDIIPNARSVIVFGIKLVSAVVNWPQLAWDESRQTRVDCWRVYEQCGFEATNERLEHMGMDLAIALELDGGQAIFFPGSNDMTVTELNAVRLYETMNYSQPLDRKKIADLKPGLESPSRYGAPFSFRHAAVAAGLATFGANNLALHPVLGPRIRFNVVITDKEFDKYDHSLKESVCLYDKGCRTCIETCPHGVFKEVGRFQFAGLSHPWSRMAGKCYYNSTPCGGTCIQTCPAGTGDKQMKKLVAKRFRDNS